MVLHPAQPYAARPPYRPFLAGPPVFAPGLSPIPPEAWLRPDPEHAANMENRVRMLAAGADAARWDAESLPAQQEALALIAAALGEAAPQTDGTTGDAPILRAGSLLADDLVVMERRGGASGHGEWRATALLLTAPTFFSAGEAHGRNLFALHGPVPGNAPSLTGIGLSARIAVLFDRIPEGGVLHRFNWTLQCGPERFTPDGARLRARAAELGARAAAEHLHLRVERQTLRRLPRTGAVLFTIRIALDPLSALDGETLAALARAYRAASPEARAYKNWAALDAAAEIAFARLS